jgi:hypothetical protein
MIDSAGELAEFDYADRFAGKIRQVLLMARFLHPTFKHPEDHRSLIDPLNLLPIDRRIEPKLQSSLQSLQATVRGDSELPHDSFGLRHGETLPSFRIELHCCPHTVFFLSGQEPTPVVGEPILRIDINQSQQLLSGELRKVFHDFPSKWFYKPAQIQLDAPLVPQVYQPFAQNSAYCARSAAYDGARIMSLT